MQLVTEIAHENTLEMKVLSLCFHPPCCKRIGRKHTCGKHTDLYTFLLFIIVRSFYYLFYVNNYFSLLSILYNIIIMVRLNCRSRLYDLFGQIEREFEVLYADNVAREFIKCSFRIVVLSLGFIIVYQYKIDLDYLVVLQLTKKNVKLFIINAYRRQIFR